MVRPLGENHLEGFLFVDNLFLNAHREIAPSTKRVMIIDSFHRGFVLHLHHHYHHPYHITMIVIMLIAILIIITILLRR